MTRFVLLNAPPRAGKNTGAEALAGMIPGALVLGMAFHLKRMVHGVYLGRAGWDADPDCFDAIKGTPQALLDGMSWRQAYIHYSEQVIKPLHGPEWFGEQFLRAARDSGAPVVLVPDSGFVPEAERVVREAGAECVLLVRIHKLGCTYLGDSRSYISLGHLGVEERDVANVHGQADAYARDLAGEVLPWLAR